MEEGNQKVNSVDGGIEPTVDADDIIIDEEEGDFRKIVKKLKDRIKACETERRQYLEGWQRSKADYINAKKEEEKNLIGLEPMIKEKILLELLPVADNFDMAFLKKEAWEKVDKNWRIGVEGIYSNLVNIFLSLGLFQIGKVGDKFNTEEYQAVGTIEVPDRDKDNEVLEVIQKGYKFRNKVVRPCRVKVGLYKGS